MKKSQEKIEKLCHKYDISPNDLEEIKNDVLSTFNEILLFEISASFDEFIIEVSTNMSEYFANTAREKLMNSWYKNYSSRLYDHINLYITCFDQSNN